MTAPKIFISIVTAHNDQDVEFNSEMPIEIAEKLVDTGREVCFVDMQTSERGMSCDEITVDGQVMCATALINRAHGEQAPWCDNYISVCLFDYENKGVKMHLLPAVIVNLLSLYREQ